MKILRVYGDDYAALHFEEKYNVNDVYAEVIDSGSSVMVIDDEDTYIEVSAHEFGEVDMDFIDFVRSYLCDYDTLKHSNFYVVEEKPMDSFWFKVQGAPPSVEYFADKIPLDANDLDATSLDGKEFYMVTWEYKGKQYQDEVLSSDVKDNLEDGYWTIIDKSVA